MIIEGVNNTIDTENVAYMEQNTVHINNGVKVEVKEKDIETIRKHLVDSSNNESPDRWKKFRAWQTRNLDKLLHIAVGYALALTLSIFLPTWGVAIVAVALSALKELFDTLINSEASWADFLCSMGGIAPGLLVGWIFLTK